jgi:hypothetical protein
MRGAQKMIDVGESGFRQCPHRLARHHQNLLTQHALDAHAVGGDFAIRRRVFAEREQWRVLIRRCRV